MTEEEYIGRPSPNVPRKDHDEKCRGKKVEKQENGPPLFKGYCRLNAGFGTDHPGDGRCKLHGGCLRGNREGTPGNQFAMKHGLSSDLGVFYDSLSARKQSRIDTMEEQITHRVIQHTGGLNAKEEEEARMLAIMSYIAMNASEYTLEESRVDDPDLLGRLRKYNSELFERMEELGVFSRDNKALTEEWVFRLESD